jgi:hypothetical protein
MEVVHAFEDGDGVELRSGLEELSLSEQAVITSDNKMKDEINDTMIFLAVIFSLP